MLYQKSGLVSKCISCIFFMWNWKICTFSPDLAVTWGFCPNDTFSLSIRVHAFWTCYNEQSLYLYVKRNCSRIPESKKRPSPAELWINKLDVSLTSMYTKVFTKWDKTKRSTKCWQRKMSVFSISCYFFCLLHFIIHWNLSRCILVRSQRRVLPYRWNWPHVSLWCQVSDWIFLLMQTLHSVLRDSSQQCCTAERCLGRRWC